MLNIFHKLQTEIGHPTEKSAKVEKQYRPLSLIKSYSQLFNNHTSNPMTVYYLMG